MGRRRTFIENEAINSATAVFAERGFAGASVDDLVRATGVNRASLYGVFGSKDGLFQRCLTNALTALIPGATRSESADAAGASRDELDLVLVALMELAPCRARRPRHHPAPGGRHRRGARPTPAGASRRYGVGLNSTGLAAGIACTDPASTGQKHTSQPTCPRKEQTS